MKRSGTWEESGTLSRVPLRFTQATVRSTSWKLTIKAQCISLLRLLKESPSLKHESESPLADAYEEAVVLAANETGLNESAFPKSCPFNLEQCLEHEFFPNHES